MVNMELPAVLDCHRLRFVAVVSWRFERYMQRVTCSALHAARYMHRVTCYDLFVCTSNNDVFFIRFKKPKLR